MVAPMAEALIAAAGVILLAVLAGLYRALRGPAAADRMMAAQLLCTGGIAVLLLLSVALDLTGVVDVALLLALLGAFASIAFVLASRGLDER
jgi:multicomponent Na+:H+ antiporter subunit F